jgi:hypothetical protein
MMPPSDVFFVMVGHKRAAISEESRRRWLALHTKNG